MSILAGEVLQPCVPPGTHAVPIIPGQPGPRSFPGALAAADDGAASVFEGLMLAAGDEHMSSVVRARAGSPEECIYLRTGASEEC